MSYIIPSRQFLSDDYILICLRSPPNICKKKNKSIVFSASKYVQKMFFHSAHHHFKLWGINAAKIWHHHLKAAKEETAFEPL